MRRTATRQTACKEEWRQGTPLLWKMQNLSDFLVQCDSTPLHFGVFFFKIAFVYLFLESGGGRDKDRERMRKRFIDWLPLGHPQPGTQPTTQACPDWELNPGPFGLQASAQSIKPHQAGQHHFFFIFRGLGEWRLKPY